MRQPVATYRDARGRLRIVEFSPSAILGGTDVRLFYRDRTGDTFAWHKRGDVREPWGMFMWRRKPVGA